MLSSASDKAKLFAENFSMNSNLDDSGISLPLFPSRTNLKRHNFSGTPKMVRKVIINLDLSKVSGPDCIPVVVLKNCEPELSYILAGESSTAKNYRPLDLLSLVSKIFEKLLNNRIFDHVEICGIFMISNMVLGILDQMQIF